jgi:sporulation protein YlmC with PRC-barrel domain
VQTDIDPRSLIGRRAFDRDGAKIGTVDEVYLDDATGAPEWAAVRTGLFTRDAFVPLEPSRLVQDELRVPFKKALIRDAPDFGVGRHLSPEQELQLYHHYGMEVPSDGVAPPAPAPDRDFGELAGGEPPSGPPSGSPSGPPSGSPSGSPSGPSDGADKS